MLLEAVFGAVARSPGAFLSEKARGSGVCHYDRWLYGEWSRRARRYSLGELPHCRLKAALKALSDRYPSAGAIEEIVSPLCCSRLAAKVIRHWVRYSIADVPTVLLKVWAKAVRDIPAERARSCSVQARSGS